MVHDETGGQADRPATTAPVQAIADELIVRLRQISEPFSRQDFVLRSVTVVGPDAVLTDSFAALVFRIDEAQPFGVSEPLAQFPIAGSLPSEPLCGLHRHVQEICGISTGGDLLVVSAEILSSLTHGAQGGYHFPAVAAFETAASTSQRHERELNLRRSLFDCGLVGIGRVALSSTMLEVFLASDAVRAPAFLQGGKRGQITMSSLGSNGRFGNQLFQYAFMKFYSLRHGLKMAVPDWSGRKLFGLKDPSSDRLALPELAFNGFSDADTALWDAADPPLDVDFFGYFQEIPSCWQMHRSLLKTLFALPARESKALDQWCAEITGNGRRELIAIHVRRQDYLQFDLPQFQIIPEQWYVDWLRDLWPTLSNPVLFVATDEPDTVIAHFAEFSPKSLADLPRSRLPDHVLDFEMLRRADYLAICNSSFSRMAAILAKETQYCFLSSSTERRIVPYEPWSDDQFWARFENGIADSWSIEPIRVGAEQAKCTGREDGVRNVYFDVTDLLFHLRSHTTISGIQRVQCEVIRNANELGQGPEVKFTVFSHKGLAVVALPALLRIIDRLGWDRGSSVDFAEEIRTVLDAASPVLPRAGDLFLATGAFWAVQGVVRHVWLLKDAGLTIGLFVHDILPISRPEYFDADAGRPLVKPVVELLDVADFIVTSSRYNRAALLAYRKARGLSPVPIDVVPLGHGMPPSSIDAFEYSDEMASLLKSEFVLCVGTIEPRKNPAYLFNIWKLMVERGDDKIPTLVFAGRKGWLIGDFLGQLKATNNLNGKIVVLHDLSDQVLETLYRKCLLTMFPSFDEGWGLPVGESLAHGKVCLASKAGGIPEVGGDCADYIDPYNVRDGYDQLVLYLDDPDRRMVREKEIAGKFPMRNWQSFAAGIMRSVRTNLERSPIEAGSATILLPANDFLAIGKRIDGSSQEAVRGLLSAEAACVSGWSALEEVGIPAFGPFSVLRFRTGRPCRTKTIVVLRFCAVKSKPVSVNLRPEFGAGQTVTIKPGSDVMATASCESGEDGVVTIYLESASSRRAAMVDRSLWKLKGFLYFQPSAIVAGPLHSKEKPGLTAGDRETDKAPKDLVKAMNSSADSVDVDSLAEFLRVPNSNWRAAPRTTIYRREPIFVGPEDRRLFMTRYRNHRTAPLGAVPDDVTFRRRSSQFVSTSRFTEGAVLDASGVAKDLGYIKESTEDPPWVVRDRNGCWVKTESFAQAIHLDGTFAIFFNGNLHNYYHWVAEGLLALDILTQALGEGSGLKILLPQTVDIAAVFDHRASLRALGFDTLPIVEVPPHMVYVDEAIWADSPDFLESVSASDVKRFQRRIASLYADRRTRNGRRLLVKRLGNARAISNFDEVEASLHPLGFETVWLEGCSIEEQILMFQSAEFVVACHGAGLTNLLYCEPGTKVIEFMPTVEMRPFFWLISQKLGLRHGMQFCSAVDGDDFQAAIRVDIGTLRRLLDLVDGDLNGSLG